MKLLRGSQRDNLFNRFLLVSQRFNFMACNCPVFTPVNTNANFVLKKTDNVKLGQDQKIIELVKITSQSWSWAHPAWGSWWIITLYSDLFHLEFQYIFNP